MTAMPPLRNILNDTPANAIDVDWNFQATEDFIATDVIKRDGSTAMEAPLNLLGPAPSSPTHAVTKGYVDTQIIPLGTIWQFAGTVPPASWAFCDGAWHSSTDPVWVPLFNIIGFAFGQESSNFRLPDMQARIAVGRSAGDALFGALGQQGGNRDAVGVAAHTHTMKNHTHALASHWHDMQNHVHNNTVSVTQEIARGEHLHSLNGSLAIFQQTGSGSNLGMSGGPAAATSGHYIPTAEPAHTHSVAVGITNAGPNNNSTTPPNNNTSNGPNDNTTDGPSVGPVSGSNYPLYTTINFIIRVG